MPKDSASEREKVSESFPRQTAATERLPSKTEKIHDLSLEKLQFTAKALLRKNKESRYNKPIEDYLICDQENAIFILMDGATRYVKFGKPYPDPSPASEAAKLFAECVHQNLVDAPHNTPVKDSLLRSITAANKLIYEYNRECFPEVDYLERDYANACGFSGVLKDGFLHFAYLADPQGYLIRDGALRAFTHTQTEIIDNLEKISRKDPSFDVVDFRKYVCSQVRNNKLHEYSFGAFTGEERALDLLTFGEVQLQSQDKLILTTDGLLPLFKYNPQVFYTNNLEFAMDEMEKLESQLNIRSDDKSIITIDIL